MEKARAAAGDADLMYQQSIKNLEEARQLWEREMEILCKVRNNTSTVNPVLTTCELETECLRVLNCAVPLESVSNFFCVHFADYYGVS